MHNNFRKFCLFLLSESYKQKGQFISFNIPSQIMLFWMYLILDTLMHYCITNYDWRNAPHLACPSLYCHLAGLGADCSRPGQGDTNHCSNRDSEGESEGSQDKRIKTKSSVENITNITTSDINWRALGLIFQQNTLQLLDSNFITYQFSTK